MRHLLAVAVLAMFTFAIGCDAPETTATKPTRPKPKRPAPEMGGAQGGPTIGEEAPEIVGKDLEGVEFKLSDYRGKVVMLDFYGDW